MTKINNKPHSNSKNQFCLKNFQQNFVSLINQVNFIPQERMQIYQNSVRCGQTKALAAIFPLAEQLLSTDNFHPILEKFITHHPCQQFNYHDYAEQFIKYAQQNLLDYLPAIIIDLFYLELYWDKAYCGVDHTKPSNQQLLALAKVDPQDLYLSRPIDCYQLQSPYPIYNLWKSLKDQQTITESNLDKANQLEYLLIIRFGEYIYLFTIDEYMWSFLQYFNSPNNLYQACEQILASQQSLDINQLLPSALQHNWLDYAIKKQS